MNRHVRFLKRRLASSAGCAAALGSPAEGASVTHGAGTSETNLFCTSRVWHNPQGPARRRILFRVQYLLYIQA